MGAYNFVFLSVVGLAFIFFPETFVELFTSDDDIAKYAESCLRWLSYGLGLFAIGLVLNQTFNGAGDTMTPTKINFFAFWLLQLPLAYWLADHVLQSPDGVFIAILLGESVMTLIAYIVFRRGSWKRGQV